MTMYVMQTVWSVQVGKIPKPRGNYIFYVGSQIFERLCTPGLMNNEYERFPEGRHLGLIPWGIDWWISTGNAGPLTEASTFWFPARNSNLDRDINYRGADKSLARPTSQCILFDGENISFDVSLVMYINSTNIPPIMIINKIYKHQNLLSL